MQRYALVEYEVASAEVRAVYDDFMRSTNSTNVPIWVKSLGCNLDLLHAYWERAKGSLVRGEIPLILKETHLRVVDRATFNIDNGSGSHVIKMGVELSSISATQNQPNNTNGTFGFLTDTSSLPNTASIAVGFTDPYGTSDAIASATGYTTGVYITTNGASSRTSRCHSVCVMTPS